MTPLDEPWPLTSWPDVPTRVLACRHDRMFPLDFQRRIARQRLEMEVDEIDGGHMLAMSNPGGLADRLEAYRRTVHERARCPAVNREAAVRQSQDYGVDRYQRSPGRFLRRVRCWCFGQSCRRNCAAIPVRNDAHNGYVHGRVCQHGKRIQLSRQKRLERPRQPRRDASYKHEEHAVADLTPGDLIADEHEALLPASEREQRRDSEHPSRGWQRFPSLR